MVRNLAFRLWRSGVFGAGVRRALRPVAIGVTHAIAAPPGFDSRNAPAEGRGPIVVSGFLSETFGVARGARLTVAALRDAGLPVLEHDVRPLIEAAGYRAAPLPTAAPGGVWLVHCNPPEALAAFARIPTAAWRSKYRIGYWAWELPVAPALWRRAARLFHEVWTPSRFVADSLDGARAPIRVMPHTVSAPSAERPDRAAFGLEDDRVWILTIADLRSSATRKNPFGAIEAFTRAFPSSQQRAGLLVKLVQADFEAATRSRLERMIAGRDDIRLMERHLTDDEMASLTASIDIYLSLHRAEGFGLGLAEALAMGRACLATGWSGNLEFMSDLDPMLAPYALTPVRDPAGVYTDRSQMWAEPDIAAAAEKLAALCRDDVLRRRMGEEGRARVAGLGAAWTREQLEAMPFFRHCDAAASKA